MCPSPTRTTNRLHFGDLAPNRFEDLCLLLIQPLHPWIEIRHYGRSGTDGGIDIYARERVEAAIEREWLVQCRRYARATTAILKQAVDDALSTTKALPDVLLVVVASDARREAHEAFLSYASERGVATPLLWTASLLEARLYNERRDLLFTFFGISTTADARRREATITRNVAMKKRLRSELVNQHVDWDRALKRPPEKFAVSEVIIRSVDDTNYPDIDASKTGISSWFKLELWDFYYNGLETIIWIDTAIIDDSGHWMTIEYGQSFDESRFQKFDVFRLARIPYANILEIDVDGDEFYPIPHLYCRFANGGQPYEGFRYVPTQGNPYLSLDPAKKLEMKSQRREK